MRLTSKVVVIRDACTKRTAPLLAGLVLCLASAVSAPAQTTVFVPGNAGGDFGNPSEGSAPLIPALIVEQPGTITITYVTGTVTDINGVDTGPEGVPCDYCAQLPLQEAHATGTASISGRTMDHLDGLIGAFVPKRRVEAPGFSPVDGAKGIVSVGIGPWHLFFVGTGITFKTKEAGTLYLGINDNWLSDNGGGFTVAVAGP